MTIVPNLFPSIPSHRRLALIGEAPGKDEVSAGQPFVGQSGKFLAKLLSRAGITREQCFLGNISQHQPPDNEFARHFTWSCEQVQHGLARLRDDLALFKPNIVVLLGNMALKAAKDCGTMTQSSLLRPRFKGAQWRGSVWICKDPQSPFYGYKCTTSYHPAFCLRDYFHTPFLQLDLRKAVGEAESPRLELPKVDICIPSGDDPIRAIRLLWDLQQQRTLTGSDIEGYWNNMSCISFAPSPTYAVVIPFLKRDGSQYWPDPWAWRIYKAVADLLDDTSVPKAFTNGLYDRFCLHYGYGMRVQNSHDDTMLKHWELYSELAKDIKESGKAAKGRKGMGLAIQVSLYTKHPYYKGDRGSQDDETFYRYNGMDSICTREIAETIERILGNEDQKTFRPSELRSMREHYRWNNALLNPLLYIEMRGMPYNAEAAAARRAVLRHKMHEAQARLNTLTGYGVQNLRKDINEAKKKMFTLKGDRVRKSFESDWSRIQEVQRLPNPGLAELGELDNVLGLSLNVNSSDQIIKYLYETLKLPTQYNDKEPPTRTADYEALLNLCRHCKKENGDLDPRLPILHTIIEISSLSTREGMLSISADRDGRIRCGYNLVGSNTGRVTSYESPTGSGYNLQTIPNYTTPSEAPGGVLGDRDLFLADDAHWFFQCDLKGADGWTVAAYSAMLGDSTMLEDYRGGVSPFERLTLKMLGVVIPKDREELKEVIKKHVLKDGWPRFACKRVQHGGCYLEGARTVSRNISKDSEGKLYIPERECQQLLDFLLVEMYWGVKRWHKWVASRISERPVLQAASGQVRQFLGRPDEILTKAVAFEPQSNTTFATNLALFKLWTDPENRVTNNDKTQLRVEPLHQVHDALLGQFKQTETQWAVGKIRNWFNNKLVIAGQEIIIPFDGGYGEGWGNLAKGKI